MTCCDSPMGSHTHKHHMTCKCIRCALLLQVEQKRLILLVKLAASLHLTALPPGSPPFSGRGGAGPSSDRVPGHPQVALLGALPGQGCPCPRGAVEGGRKEEVLASRKHQGRSRDFPETSAGSRESERVSDPLPPSVSAPQQSGGNRSPPASGSWRRSPRGPGGRRAGRGGESRGGAGLQAQDSEARADFSVPGSAKPVRSSQVRALRAGEGGPGPAPLGAGKGGWGCLRREQGSSSPEADCRGTRKDFLYPARP